MRNNGLKKLLAGLSAACLAAAAMPAVSYAAETADTAAKAVVGDSNCDGSVDMSDVVLIMQAMANPNKFGLGGTDEHAITEQGWKNADCNGKADGVSTDDALAIQLYLLGKGEISSGKTDEQPPAVEATKIHLKNTTITVEGENATVEGTTVTITHSGEFYIDGTLDDGQINVNIADETADAETVKIFLNGVNITGKSAPAILVTNAENTSINIVDGTENTITDGETAYAGDFAKAALIEAKDDITIKGGEKGDGVLNITANVQDAISCNNDIKVNGGIINITTNNSETKTDGIKAKKSVTIKDGTLDIDAAGDGIKSTKDAISFSGGITKIKAGNDAVQAETTIDISDGKLVAGGDRGLTAVTGINITGGTVIATATDNQVDEKLIKAETQPVILLNCIADPTNEKDGTWKKANNLEWTVMRPEMNVNTDKTDFQKKYKYILISTYSITAGTTNFTNTNVNKWITHTNSEESLFAVSNGINVFNNVNPAGAADNVNVPPSETNA
jgi:hypothetical protein